LAIPKCKSLSSFRNPLKSYQGPRVNPSSCCPIPWFTASSSWRPVRTSRNSCPGRRFLYVHESENPWLNPDPGQPRLDLLFQVFPYTIRNHLLGIVKPVYNDHPRDPKIVAVVDNWSLFRVLRTTSILPLKARCDLPFTAVRRVFNG